MNDQHEDTHITQLHCTIHIPQEQCQERKEQQEQLFSAVAGLSHSSHSSSIQPDQSGSKKEQ